MELPNKESAELHRYILHMNGNQDQLLAIVKHAVSPAKLPKGDLGQLIILKVTPEGDGLVLIADEPANLPSKWPKNQPFKIKIPLEPPLEKTTSHWELEERLTALKQEAFKRYNIDETPQVKEFNVPPPFPYLVPILCALSFQMFALFGPDKLGGASLRRWIHENLGRYALTASVVVMLLSHVMEAAYMYTQCTKHRSPFPTTVRYCLGTFLVGAPVISEFSEKVLRIKVAQVYERSAAELSAEPKKTR